MTHFLDELVDLIEYDNEEEIKKIVQNNRDTLVSSDKLILFSRQSGSTQKQKLKGAVNINGSGGSGYVKPNLSSIATLYLGLSTDRTFVKTGSSSVSGLWGSTEFFREWGLMNPDTRNYIFEKYGFAYYDYLEVSPWKKYKNLLRQNVYLDKLFWETVFFDYETSYYFLGISRKEYHDGLQRLNIENKPQNALITFYTELDDKIVDEIFIGKVYLNNNLLMNETIEYDEITDLVKLKKVNKQLLDGTEQGYWKECLKLTYCVIARELGIVKTHGEAIERFEQVYTDKVVKKVRKEIYGN